MASAVWTPVGAAAVLPLCDGRIPGAGAGNGLIPINAFLIRSMGRLILVDTGLGDKWLDDEPDLVRADGSVVDGLRRAGVDPLDIHTVINTHLHVDHAGGNTAFDRTRVAIAAFPGANYVIQAAEWAFAASPGDWSALFRTDDFLPLAGTGRLRLVDGPTAITDEVQCVPRPGHTPGAARRLRLPGGPRRGRHPLSGAVRSPRGRVRAGCRSARGGRGTRRGHPVGLRTRRLVGDRARRRRAPSTRADATGRWRGTCLSRPRSC